MSLIKGQGAGEVSTGFYSHLLDQSLKFNEADTSYLTRTITSAGDRKKSTFSCWFKLSGLGGSNDVSQTFYNQGANNGSYHYFIGFYNNAIYINDYDYGSSGSPGSDIILQTNRLFRDTSAWYHLVVRVDTTQSTAADRVRVYINGTQETSFATATYPSQNADLYIMNHTQSTNGSTSLTSVYIGRYINGYNDGYMAEVNYCDGQTLGPDSFGETKNGIWIPKNTSGLTFGTNGFHLTFKDDVVSEGFNTVTYTANAGTQSISGLGFEQDGLVWIKDRNNTADHGLFDAVRGAGKSLKSNTTAAEQTQSDSLTSFDSDGFSLGDNTEAGPDVNYNNGDLHVAWCWEAGGTPTADNSAGAGATPTAGSVKIDGSNLGSALAGSIAATRISANTARGFSIVTWTGDGGQTTVGHGLGATPKIVIQKKRGGTSDWWFYTTAVDGSYDYLKLNATDAKSDYAQTAPTSTTFVSHGWGSDTMVAYCFAEISGYSKIDSYSGSGSSGKAVTGLGFEPAWLMVKRTDGTSNWAIYDNTRSPVDPRRKNVWANLSDQEYDNSSYDIDFDADGFTLRTSDSQRNASGGTYIYMAFADTREAAFFKDVSSNGNHFTPVNLDYRDSVPDVPTNNFAVLNALGLASGFSLSEGNLQIATTTSGNRSSFGNFIPASGKWYFEANVRVISAIASWANFGVAPEASSPSTNPQSSSGGISFQDSGRLFVNGSSTDDWIADWAVGSILQCAFDADTGKVWLGRNNTYGGSGDPASGSNEAGTISGKIKPLFGQSSGDNRSTTLIYNFGQDSSFAGNHATANSNADGNGHGSFAYAPPSGFLALCSQNLPDVDIIDGTEHFDTITYSGSASNQTITTNFQADFLWFKERTTAGIDHNLFDSVRLHSSSSAKFGRKLESNTTDAETDSTVVVSQSTNDITLLGGISTTNDAFSRTYVMWHWLAGTAFSNDASATGVGTIDSEGQVNTTAGFSILTYTGNYTAGATVAHGLGATPKWILIKKRGGADDWFVYHDALGATKGANLNTTAAAFTGTVYNNTAPTSSVFSLGQSNGVNENSQTFVAYCWAEVEGYSKFGSYVGNGNSDGPFIHTGFRPAWIMIKNITDAGEHWEIWDSTRDPDNVVTQRLRASSSGADASSTFMDFVSNGVKHRNTSGGYNASGKTFIYLAFAEQPFKFSNAR